MYSVQTRPQVVSLGRGASYGEGAQVYQGAQATTVAAPAAAAAQQQAGTLTMQAGGDFHEQAVNQNADGIRLISLGCYCGPKLSFRALGRDAETLPFDWVRTRIDGLLHFIQNDFDKFFYYDTRETVPGTVGDKPMVMHRSFYHSFWHDDVTKEETFEKYRRRMERFKNINARDEPVLFVRSVATTDEFMHTDKLYNDLQKRFGRCARLLLIVDFQPEDEFVTVSGCENLLIAKLHHRAHEASNNGAPYQMPILKAIEWIKTGRLPGATAAPGLSQVKLNPTTWGLMGLGGLKAFEEAPQGGMVPLPSAGLGAIAGAALSSSPGAAPTPVQTTGVVSAPSAAMQSTGTIQQGQVQTNGVLSTAPTVVQPTGAIQQGQYTVDALSKTMRLVNGGASVQAGGQYTVNALGGVQRFTNSGGLSSYAAGLGYAAQSSATALQQSAPAQYVNSVSRLATPSSGYAPARGMPVYRGL